MHDKLCRLVFEEGELEAIEAGLDTSMDWKALMRPQGQHSEINVSNVMLYGTCTESTPSEANGDVPVLSRCLEPNTVCGRPASQTQPEHDKVQVARSALLLFHNMVTIGAWILQETEHL